MSRKDLKKFDPSKLKPGATRLIEVVDRQTGYHEVHFFCRDDDGELLTGVVHGHSNAYKQIRSWKALKRARAKDLKQLAFVENSNGTTDHQT